MKTRREIEAEKDAAVARGWRIFGVYVAILNLLALIIFIGAVASILQRANL